MCRQHELWGWILIAFGAGVLFGFLLESGFLRCIIGIGAIVLGISTIHKK